MNQIYSVTPFTFTDFPNKIACVAWFGGCNMRCIYCYNVPVVEFDQSKGVSNDDFVKFLASRVGKLNGVVFSGGECTLAPGFLKLLNKAKKLNFATKVDTNGTNFKAIQTAINENLIDYIALDFKAPSDKFKLITCSNLYKNFIQTLKFLIKIDFNFEVRTTIHSDFLSAKDISKMAEILENLGYKNSYFLQNFLATNHNFKPLQNPKSTFDFNDIKTNLKIELRNF